LALLLRFLIRLEERTELIDDAKEDCWQIVCAVRQSIQAASSPSLAAETISGCINSRC